MKCKRCPRSLKFKDGFVRIGKKKYYVCDFCVELFHEMNDKAQEVAYRLFILPIEQNDSELISH